MKKNKKILKSRLLFSDFNSLLYRKENEERISKQFCGFCVRVLKNEMFSIGYEQTKDCLKKKSIELLAYKESAQMSKCDNYFNEEHTFNVLNKEIVVFGDFLAGALNQLSPEKRDVILMSYFLGMTDKEIGRHLNLIQQTVFKRRKAALKLLNNLLKDEVLDNE